MRKIITDTDALLYSALKSQNSAPTVSDGWIPVSDDAEPPREGWLLTHKGRDYFYRNQADAVAHMNAAIDANDGPLSILHLDRKDNAPSGTWIPVSERMPEPGRWLALYGAPVYTRGPDAGKPWCKFSVGEGYLDKEDGKFYLLNWESPGEIGDSYNNLLAIATHWMYWELPDAPKVKP